jgi:hypothetical protein
MHPSTFKSRTPITVRYIFEDNHHWNVFRLADTDILAMWR